MLTLDQLNVSKTLLKQLEGDHWTVQKVATTSIERLEEYHLTRSDDPAKIIQQARDLINKANFHATQAEGIATVASSGEWEPVPTEPHQHSVRIQRLIDEDVIKVDEYNRII